jgi:hypothetical protein
MSNELANTQSRERWHTNKDKGKSEQGHLGEQSNTESDRQENVEPMKQTTTKGSKNKTELGKEKQNNMSENRHKGVCQIPAYNHFSTLDEDLPQTTKQRQNEENNQVQSAQATRKRKERIITFRGPKNPLSNLYPCNLKEGGIPFKSGEHKYQYKKAIHHGNDETAERILQAPSAIEAKRIGDSIQTKNDWRKICRPIMEEIISEKLKSCVPFRNCLLSSDEAILVEATRDKYWGAGLLPHECKRSSEYPGENMLSKILMNAREACKSMTPEVLILSDSHGHRVDPNKISSLHDVYKKTTYKISDATQVIRNMRQSPKAIFIQVGTNDILNKPNSPIQEWKDLFHACEEIHPDSRIMIGSIPPVRDQDMRRRIQEANKWMEQFCRQKGTEYIRNENVMSCSESPFVEDGIHLNMDGFYKLADNMFYAINNAISG